jgi:AraC-like DNA-binding protein
VTRLALVRPAGLGGAIVAGAYDVLPRPYPVEVFDAIAPAAAWVAAEAELDAERIAALLAEIHADATGGGPVVAALRGWLGAHLAEPSVAAAALALGTSERTLQRKLQEADTTFLHQVAEARVRAATRLLLDSDAPLTAIAYEVGCASLQHFSALFRKHTELSPSAYRRRHKRG